MPVSAKSRILVVDDHIEMSRLLADQLGDAGFEVETANSGLEAIAAARSQLPDLVLTDLRMEEVDGLDVLDAVRAMDVDIPVLIMTAFGNIESAVEAIKRGATQYVTKPFRLEEVVLQVRRALEERRLRWENRSLRKLAIERAQLGAMIGRSQPMRALYELIERIGPSQAPVLVRGESGTGKELIARAIHLHSPRKERALVAVNCTSLPASLLESELFGHVRGAFTGATSPRRGLFVEADGGTLFLDEIGDMPLELQAKVLRVVEDGEVRAVGADGSRRVDVRLIAATHRDLEERVREGAFRQDLFYRLNVVPLSVPALRERKEDVPLLVDHFLARARERNPHTRVEGFSPDVVAALARAPWPGNVRELENLIERLVVVCSGAEVSIEDLELHVSGLVGDASPLLEARQKLVPLRQLEDDYIAWVVARCDGNKTRAAEILGIDVSTIHRRSRDR
jgi:two-component system, NtrC family, response regulator HydG